uniref:Uncharacterized protein n=1 Tax=Noctiluca scintillans TaxID=2966 RepID=A0A7S1AT39_NOCSC|mmetsp:Transcript_58385/g.155392  ORF Transcript_58385/g.155392 Transcript_58385/m.155392 type:complete len:148 (+) Transcript_58385:90-533(+)
MGNSGGTQAYFLNYEHPQTDLKVDRPCTGVYENDAARARGDIRQKDRSCFGGCSEPEDEQYANLLFQMQLCLDAEARGTMSKRDAFCKCRELLDQIQALEKVDIQEVRKYLLRRGLSDKDRLDLEQRYQSLVAQVRGSGSRRGPGCC